MHRCCDEIRFGPRELTTEEVLAQAEELKKIILKAKEVLSMSDLPKLPDTIRCKLRLSTITEQQWSKDSKQTKLVFETIYDESIPEDQRFCKATPSGKFEMVVDNPIALQFFEIGKYYYFDAIKCD